MGYLFVLLMLLSFLALIVGLIKPDLVIRWGNKKTRGQVLKYYGLATIIFFILGGLLIPKPTVKNMVKEARQNVKEQNYKEAVRTYNEALENWNKKEDYSFEKTKIINEHNEAKKSYSKNVINNIKIAINNMNLDKAKELANQAQETVPNNELIKNLKFRIETLNQALEGHNWKKVIGMKILTDRYVKIAIELRYFEDKKEAVSYYFKNDVNKFYLWTKSNNGYETKKFFKNLWGRQLKDGGKRLSFMYKKGETKPAPEQYKRFVKSNDLKCVYVYPPDDEE